MSKTKSAFKELKKKLDDLRSEYEKTGKKAFGEESRALFDLHPKMKTFGWRQYTPYFNDGEPCTFRCYSDDPEINEIEYWYSSGPSDWAGEKVETQMTKEEFEAAKKDVTEFLSAFDSDLMLHIFGDHVRVSVTKKGAKVEEYSHD